MLILERLRLDREAEIRRRRRAKPLLKGEKFQRVDMYGLLTSGRLSILMLAQAGWNSLCREELEERRRRQEDAHLTC